jgi:hypothetical protein
MKFVIAVSEYKRNRIIMSRAQKEGQEDLLYSKCTKKTWNSVCKVQKGEGIECS